MAFVTSELYKEAINKESRVTFISGQITTANGVVIPIDNDVVSQGSCYITNQCVNNDAFEYGSVFAAESGITLKTDISRYSLFNAKLELDFNILLKDNTYETVPLGIFYANDVARVGRNVVIKAYDQMIDLDKPIIESVTGTATDLLHYISTKCNVELAQADTELVMLPNSGLLLSVSPDRVSTYRDLLSQIAKITCTFAHIDRAGKLKLGNYGTTTTKVIDPKQRASSKFSDFETYYSHITANFVFDNSLKLYSASNDGAGLEYNAGDIPVVQGVDMTNQSIVDRMFSEIERIKYIPCEFSFIGDPSVDLGDQVINIDRDGNEIKSIVTFYKWTYRGGHQIKSAGQNPKLVSSKDKAARDIMSLRADVNAKDIVVCTATNGVDVRVDSFSPRDVSKVTFVSSKDSVCMAMITVPYEVASDDEVEFRQFLDGVELLDSAITQYCHQGKGTTTFTNFFNVIKGNIHTYSVAAKTKVGGLVVKALTSRVIVFGQGLIGEVSWDGTFTIGDVIFAALGVGRGQVEAILGTDLADVQQYPYNPNEFIDQVNEVSVSTRVITAVGFTDEIKIE